MDAQDVLAIVRSQLADLEDNLQSSDDNHCSAAIQLQQQELKKQELCLEDALQARGIARLDINSQQLIDGIRRLEQQAISDRRLAAAQNSRILNLSSLQSPLNEDTGPGRLSEEYIRDAMAVFFPATALAQGLRQVQRWFLLNAVAIRRLRKPQSLRTFGGLPGLKYDL